MTNGFMLFMAVYFSMGACLGLAFLFVLWIFERPGAAEHMPDDVRILMDQFYVTMDMLGWSAATFAIVIAVMWLPMKLGWRIY